MGIVRRVGWAMVFDVGGVVVKVEIEDGRERSGMANARGC